LKILKPKQKTEMEVVIESDFGVAEMELVLAVGSDDAGVRVDADVGVDVDGDNADVDVDTDADVDGGADHVCMVADKFDVHAVVAGIDGNVNVMWSTAEDYVALLTSVLLVNLTMMATTLVMLVMLVEMFHAVAKFVLVKVLFEETRKQNEEKEQVT